MKTPALLVAILLLPTALQAQAQRTQTGPIIHSAGAVFEVARPDFVTPTDIDYRVAFEVATTASSPDQLNQSLNTVARFVNMHAKAGVPRERIDVAVVVHGPAGWDLLNDSAYREHHGTDNPNAALIRELVEAGMQVVLCGQTAASRGIPRAELIPGVQMALSAMTAFSVLSADGYQVNPW